MALSLYKIYLKPLKYLFSAAIIGALSPLAMANNVCNPLSTQTCVLPFPSNYVAKDDASSETQVRLEVSNDAIRPELLAQLPIDEGFSPEGIFNGASGFSAASMVVFEFPEKPKQALPIDGADSILAYDIDSGERIDIRVQWNKFASGKKVSSPSNVLMVNAVSRWPYGKKVLVVIKKDAGLIQETSFEDYRQGAMDNGQKTDYIDALANHIERAGLNTNDVLTATYFTVRARSEVLDPIRTAVDNAYYGNKTVRKMKVLYNPFSFFVHARITGEINTDNYRGNNGTTNVDFTKEPKEQWIPFVLTLPNAARMGGAPVALYAHGLGVFKESDVVVSETNASLGIATFSIDFPNHGARAKADGGLLLQNISPKNVPLQTGMVNQAPIDFAAAHSALNNSLSQLDVASKPSWFNWLGWGADGRPDLNTDQIMMQGTSLGGVLGSAYAALSPNMKSAMFQVTGTGVSSILSESVLWDSMFHKLMPKVATGSEAVMLLSAMQQSLDFGDPINHVDLLRNPDRAHAPRPTFILTGAGDSLVGNNSSIAAAHLMELPLVGAKLYDMRGITRSDDFDDGFGVKHYQPLAQDWMVGPTLSKVTAHMSFLDLMSVHDQRQWIKRFFLAQ